MKADRGSFTPFGFSWGPMEVNRCTTFERNDGRTRVVQVITPFRTVDIYVSETGRSVRVFEQNKELKPRD
jgi:hypothetical protein